MNEGWRQVKRDGHKRPVLLVSEWFPPAVGGSAVLLSNIYANLSADVEVLAGGAVTFPRGLGLLDPHSALDHLRLARRLRHLSAGSVVHCGRALSEGTIAVLSGRRPYICWTHGEELPIAARSRELSWLMQQVHHRSAALIANSRNTASLLVALGNPEDKIHVVLPGVDASRFTPETRSADLRRRLAQPGETLLLSVGRLQARKGHDLVIRTLASIATGPHVFRYVVVGDGPERGRLERLASDLGVAGRVTFVGTAGSEELPAYYATADIFLHPNRIEAGDFEGFGIVFLEAAASGVPAIGGRTGGAPEAVEDARTGLLVGGDDVEEMRQAILALADSPERRAHMGSLARERVVKEFSWQRAARQVDEIDREVRSRCGLPVVN